MVNFRNVIVHGYFGIDADEVWDIIANKLDNLNHDLYQIVNKHYDLNQAIELTIEEYIKLNDKNTVEYLQTVSAVLQTIKHQ
ncbi:HepT-like ribonuclease domain-containing protein [Sulfurospirillum sp. 1307]